MTRRKTTEEFIDQAIAVHGDTYDYSKVDYKNAHTKVHILCSEHGEFLQTPANHLSGKGCRDCGLAARSQKLTSSLEEFIEKAKGIHGDTYDYSKVGYVNTHTNVAILCQEHGEFFANASPSFKWTGLWHVCWKPTINHQRVYRQSRVLVSAGRC